MHLNVLAFQAIAATALTFNTANAHSWAARIDARDAPAIRAALDGGQPFVAAGALSHAACDAWTGDLLEGFGDAVVTTQIAGDAIDAPLEAFFYDALASTHEEPRFLFDEELLDGADGLRAAAIAAQRIFGEESWLDSFPAERRPADACVVCAGAGARSPLHRDPYDWTGTSLCLEGSKVWRFLLDVEDSDLDAYKLPSEAFGDDSAGTQSDIDLYCFQECDWPDAEAFDDDRDLVEAMAGPENFAPSHDVPGRFCTALQFAGDVVVVSPKAWHQTYALGPSCAVASQFCGRRNAPAVFEHMLRHRSRPDDGILDLARTAPPQDAVEALFAHLDSPDSG
jgi:hypothetical protein